jgi:hypothetical protein
MMSYGLKLLDIVIQGTAILSGFMLYIVFDVYGYFYWIIMGVLCWILMSSILHLLFLKRMSMVRIMFSTIFTLAIVLMGIAYLTGASFPKINFYLEPLSFVFSLIYLLLCISELPRLKSDERESLDF